MEEQRQVLDFLCWQSKRWLDRVSLVITDDPVLEEGLKAYAQQQAAIKVDLEKHFAYTWRNAQRYVELAGGVDGDTSITFS